MTDRAWPLLVIAIVLAVFLPAFSAEICNLDDVGMVASIQHAGQWNLLDLFLRKASEGLYYRPLSYLTFLINQTVFGLSAFSLHAENVIVHLANTLLVFFIIQRLLKFEESKPSPKTAFVGSLLFGLHPLVTESVNWISGRTDLIMGFFLLISVFCLIQYRISEKRYLIWFAALSFLCALLSKESAIAFLPGFFLILYAKSLSAKFQASSDLRTKIFIMIGITLLVVGTFFLLRTISYSSNSSRIGVTLQYMQINPSHSFFLFLRATGFYLIKLVFPWPLNLAIDDVDPLYELAAMPLIALCLYIAAQRTMNSAVFTAGLLLFSPALLIALNQIAWMPYAERYLYSTTAFAAIALVMYCQRRWVMLPPQWQYIFATVVLLVFAGTTFQRNNVWQKNINILADTAKKSPENRIIQWLYGSELLKEGRYQEALPYSQKAAGIHGNPLFYDQNPVIDIGRIQYLQGNIVDAITTFKTVVKKSSGKSPEAQEGLLDCYQALWRSAAGEEEKEKYFQAMKAHAELLFALRPEPLLYYNLGKLALTDNDPEEARMLFTKAAANMKENHEYYPFVHKLLSNDISE